MKAIYGDLMGPTEKEYGRWFVRICMVLFVNFYVGMTALLYAFDSGDWGSPKDPSPLWEYYGMSGIIAGFFAAMVWIGRWVARRDKMLFGIYIAGCISWFLAQYYAYGAVTDEEHDKALDPWIKINVFLAVVAGLRVLWLKAHAPERQSKPTGVTIELAPKFVKELAFHTCALCPMPSSTSVQLGYKISTEGHTFSTFSTEMPADVLTSAGYRLLSAVKALPGVSEVLYETYCFMVIVDQSFDRDDVLVEVLDLMESQRGELILSFYDLTTEFAHSDEAREINFGPYNREGVLAKLTELEKV